VDLAAFAVHVAGEALEQQLDLRWIEPDVLVAQLVDGCRNGLREGIQRAFTGPVDALIGV